MSLTVRVTRRARRDLLRIGDYTEEVWGHAQRNAYLQDLTARFHWLAVHPDLGRRRDDLGRGLRSYRQGQHLIFYRVTGGSLEVVGVPHGSMDHSKYFDQ